MYDLLDHDGNMVPFIALMLMSGRYSIDDTSTMESHQCTIDSLNTACCCDREAINRNMESNVSQVSEIRDLQIRLEAQRMQAEIQSLNASVINQLQTQITYRPTDKVECEMNISDEKSNDDTLYYSDNRLEETEESIARTIIDVDRDDEDNPYYEEKNADHFEKDAKYESEKRMLNEKMAEVKRAHSVGMLTTEEACRMISAIYDYGCTLNERHELKERYIRLGKSYVDSIHEDSTYKAYMECKARTKAIIESHKKEKEDIYHDKSHVVRAIRKIVNKLNDIIGAIIDDLKEDFI